MNPAIIITYPAAPDTPVTARIEGKFVQLRLKNEEYLVFAEAGLHRFHNQILAQFLTDRGLPHRWRDDQTLEVDLPEFAVSGGGRFRADPETRTLELWNSSQAYGRFEERGLPEKIAAAGHAWSGFTIRIA